jgi:thiamine biosynthesis lipoprotein
MSANLAAKLSHLGMNTRMEHQAYGEAAEEALEAVRAEAVRLENLLSRFLPDSEIGRINRSAGKAWEPVGAETFAVLSRALRFSALGAGRFDVTIGPLAALWSRGKESRTPPEEAEIEQARRLVDYRDLALDPEKKTACLARPGQSVDLGGIAKGYAADRFLQIFRDYGLRSAFTNLGGNVAALGTKPDGSPWRVGIQHPRQENRLIGLVAVENRSVVTSGDYQRYYTGRDGIRYHHILEPTPGRPARAGLVSATVVSDSSMDADALSTLLFVFGLEKGLPLLRQVPGAQAVLIDHDLQVHITAGLTDRFQAAEGTSINILT